jgi:hypothetical protein
MDQSEEVQVSPMPDEAGLISGQPPARRLNSFAKVARQRIKRNRAAAVLRAPEPVATPAGTESLPASTARRAEAALLISAILELRPDLNGALSVSAGAESFLEPDLLDQIDRIAAQRGSDPSEHARISLINAIVRDWLSAYERVAQVAAR